MTLIKLRNLILYGISCYVMLLLFSFALAESIDAPTNSYVGSTTCQGCHEKEYQNFVKYARKSNSFKSVLKMKGGLTGEEIERCYDCHTTGHGKPGGFVSLEKTPELKDAGCEVCHGPGRIHAESGDPDDIERGVKLDTCQECHTQERVAAFRYRPLLHGGGH